MNDILERLESNNKEVVENVKQSLREQFMKVNESWLLNGLYDYYLQTNSERALEILINIREPHYGYLFDRLSESMKGQKSEVKVQSLTVLGYIARSQPTWLYKLQDHALLRDMLYLLKNEVELLPLISALLVLIVLLPMLPSTMGFYLREIFDIFRLYGMFPCNFISYLRNQYKDKNKPVFVHTIKPMLHTVRMHPSLVTASKDTETATERWRKMKVHDVIVECERFSLDLIDRCPHDSCQYSTGFRSRSGTTNSTIEPPYQLSSLKSLTSLQMPTNSDPPNFFTPSRTFATPPITESIPTNILQIQEISSSAFPSQEGTSPPEAAIEATPETTPIRDYHSGPMRHPPANSSVVRALTTFGGAPKSGGLRASPLAPPSSAAGTPFNSQPSSPMRPKDGYGTSAAAGHPTLFTYPSTLARDPPAGAGGLGSKQKISRQFSSNQRIESPLSQEDEEVLSIVSKGSAPTTPRAQPPSAGNDLFLQDFEDDDDGDGGERAAEEEQEQAKGSPCTAGGLHMPNSKSMNNFAKRVQRLRHHSQCNPEPERIEVSTGSSPGRGSNTSAKDNIDKPLKETDEEATVEKSCNTSHNESNGSIDAFYLARNYSSNSTQTENFWPYEHLFLAVFPSLESNDYKPSPVPTVYTNDRNTVQYLKDQLQLVHQHLLFERHRREIHAYRNRRLLSDAKSTRLLEECNSALKFKSERLEEELKWSRTVQYWEEQMARQQAKAGEKGRKELEQLSKELLMLGELQLKYQEKLEHLESKRMVEEDLRLTKEAYKEEIRALNQHLESKAITLDSYRNRMVELEHALEIKEDMVLAQKQLLSGLNEQHFEKLETMKDKLLPRLRKPTDFSLLLILLQRWKFTNIWHRSIHYSVKRLQ
ncbi:unnamed protein product [Callosobruchus maculatus]|uniref:Hamartin n=1 Tax=Callosobruchus maculatus TaxID=64391 RepID=A0A653C051_CALMS|nr:unnamed protein product [Callosobruchus maculatus]